MTFDEYFQFQTTIPTPQDDQPEAPLAIWTPSARLTLLENPKQPRRKRR